ncbi:MAG: hypothetical protein U0401_12235 [Anaerolineae bacterium]
MNLTKRIIAQLEQLTTEGFLEAEAAQLPDGGYFVGVVAEKGEPTVAITLEAYDRFSVMLRCLEVAYDNLAGQTQPDDLLQQADRIAQRLTYLEEPLALVELDSEAKLAQLRSAPPHQEGETLTYWELLLWTEPHPRARLTRYCWTPGQTERELVVYPATFATVGRIAQDLAANLQI